MKKRITALALIMILMVISISGCSKEEKDNSPEQPNKDNSAITELSKNEQELGRYEEQDISLPETISGERIFQIIKNPNGQIEVYASDFNTSLSDRFICYTLQDDGTWVRSNAMWLNGGAVGTDRAIVDIFTRSNGDYYASYPIWGQDKYGAVTMTPVIIVSTDGGKTAEKLDIPYIVDAEIFIDRLVVMDDGTFVIHDYAKEDLLTLSSNGERLDDITGLQTRGFIPYGNYIVGMNKDGTELVFYNVVTREVDKTIEYTLRNKDTPFALHILEDETILLGDVNGIHRFSKDGTLWETIVDGWLSSMSIPNLDILDLCTGNTADEYYAAYEGTDLKYRIKHYSYNESIPAYPETEITVYSLTENKTVSYAITLFQAMNPGVRVNYEIAMLREEEENASDYIRVLNTELLSGNGADVLILDGLPVKSYIEKGVLGDISDVILPLLEDGKLYSNIAENYKEYGKIYQMPVRFSVPIIIGDKDALSSMDSVEGIAEYIKGTKTGLPFAPKIAYDSVISDYLALYSDDLFQEGKLSEEKYITFLESLKIIADNIGADEYSFPKDYYLGDNYAERITDTPEYLFGGNPYDCFVLDGKRTVNTYTMPMIEFSIFDYINAIVKEYDLEINNLDNAFIPYGMVGLNQASKKSDIAKDFIRLLFSYPVQQENFFDGFPVTTASLNSWMNMYCGQYTGQHSWLGEQSDRTGGFINEYHLLVYSLTKEERDRYEEIICNAKTPMEPDFTLVHIMIEQSMPFFLGKADAKQAAAAVASKVNTYQSE